jgi:myo-inositol-1(or 4)-monophosphatase
MTHAIPEFFDNQSDLMKTAATAAVAAGEVIKAGYQKVHKIDSKGVGDLVSKVDFEADMAAKEVLQNSSHPFPIMSEELSPEVDDTNQTMWVVDPLDGTTAYLMGAGTQFSSVLIAVCENGSATLGVTYFPMQDEWFYASKGKGAFKNGKRLVIDSRPYELKDAWVEMNQYGDAAYETDFFSKAKAALRSRRGARIATSTFPHAGIAMRVAEQANGLCAVVHDNNPDSVKQGPWDIAANQLIFEEAGGLFLTPDLKRTSPFVAEPIIITPTFELGAEIANCVTQKQLS